MSHSSSRSSTPSLDNSAIPSPPPSFASTPNLPNPFHLSLSKSNATIHRINKLLSTTPNLDLTLGTISYTLSFLAAILRSSRISTSAAGERGHRYSAGQRLRTLGALLAETRVTLRLVGGVVGVWGSSVEAFGVSGSTATPSSPPINHSQQTSASPCTATETPLPPAQTGNLLKYLTRASVLAAFTCQILENVAFLGDKGVLHLSKEKRGKLWLYCSRAWCAGLGVELGRLGLQGMRFRQQDVGGQDGKEVRRADEAAVPEDVALLEEDHDEGAVGAGLDKTKAREKTPEIDKEVEMACQERNTAQRQQLREKWTRSIEINTLYMLMALHYSTEGGVMGEAMLSLCGCLASWLGLREAWRRIGAEEDM